MKKEFKYNLLLLNSNKIENNNIFLQHTKYLTIMLPYYHLDPSLSILLDGFVEFHKTVCPENDCPSRKDYKSTAKYAKLFGEEPMEQVLRLTHMIHKFYIINLQKNPNSTASRLYFSLFLLDRMGQKQMALQEITFFQNYKQAGKNDTMASEMINQSNPIIFISGEEETLGIIQNLNLGAACLLGYNKGELLNKKINLIMSNFISKYHDEFISNFMSTGEIRILNREILLPAKNKMGFLVPIFATVKLVPMTLQGVQFMCLIKLEKSFKMYNYILIDNEGFIEIYSRYR